MRITPGSSNNSTPTKTNVSTTGSEGHVIDGNKSAENEISLEASLASMNKSSQLVHSKSTGNLLGGKMRRIKEALRLFFVIPYHFTLIIIFHPISKKKIIMKIFFYLVLVAIVDFMVDISTMTIFGEHGILAYKLLP